MNLSDGRGVIEAGVVYTITEIRISCRFNSQELKNCDYLIELCFLRFLWFANSKPATSTSPILLWSTADRGRDLRSDDPGLSQIQHGLLPILAYGLAAAQYI